MIEKTPGRVDLTPSQLSQTLSEIQSSNLKPGTKQLLTDALKALVWLQNTLEQKRLTIKKLLRVFFGNKTESQANLLGKNPGDESQKPESPEFPGSKDNNDKSDGGGGVSLDARGSSEGEKKKGHGKRGAGEFTARIFSNNAA